MNKIRYYIINFRFLIKCDKMIMYKLLRQFKELGLLVNLSIFICSPLSNLLLATSIN